MELYIPIAQSTIQEPIKFFEGFFQTNAIEKAYDNFLPNLNNPDSDWHRFPVTIDKDHDCFTVEYEIEVYGEEDDEISGPSIHRREEKTYSFEGELNKRLKHEYFNSKQLLEEAIKSQNSILKAKNLCLFCLGTLKYLFGKAKESRFKKYNECTRPISRLLYYMYDQRKDYLPDADNEVKKIILLWDKEDYIPKEIRTSIVNGLLTIKDDMDNNLVEYSDGEYDPTNLRKDLFSFITGNFNNISKVLNFSWPKEPVCYLLTKINPHSPGFSLKRLEESKKILLKKGPFTANGCSKNANEFQKNPTKLLLEIDKLIDDSLI